MTATMGSNGNYGGDQWRVKVGLAEMLKGGVIMDVTNVEQARIAEDAGACAVMALERVPSDIRKEGGVARMANIEIMEAIAADYMEKVQPTLPLELVRSGTPNESEAKAREAGEVPRKRKRNQKGGT